MGPLSATAGRARVFSLLHEQQQSAQSGPQRQTAHTSELAPPSCLSHRSLTRQLSLTVLLNRKVVVGLT